MYQCQQYPLGAGRKILSYVQFNMHLNQYTQVLLHTTVNIMQNTELQIFLSAMNISIYIFIHSGLRLLSIPSFSVLSWEQNTALQKKFTERNLHVSNLLLVRLAASLHREHNECHRAHASTQSSPQLKALVNLKIHHRSGEVRVSNGGKNIFFLPIKNS